MKIIAFLALGCASAFTPTSVSRHVVNRLPLTVRRGLGGEGDPTPTALSSTEEAAAATAEAAAATAVDGEEGVESTGSAQFDLKSKLDKTGPGFNQFDPVLTVTSFISRRFGLAGGLAIVGLLAATEGQEILKSVLSTGPTPGSGEVITTASGLIYEDVLIGSSAGELPGVDKIVGFEARVMIGDQVLFDTAGGKPVAFKFGQRPFQNVVCEGLEEGILGMRVGSRRKITVPQELAPPGVKLPPGVAITYDVTVTEVLNNYL
eukprot:CAMPEP_0171850940 /NCGR_PEP_ID=MMETSP0992-20121227/20658_1 /TAXON_ID=483369 /ORGANISM="non described non described, Strain CCMP2098" /LENGTH=261 /DNA_ID=CAMNT_0012470611 /DNA_START=40 /DNA_END=825 /DNA_ORIENTATION=+